MNFLLWDTLSKYASTNHLAHILLNNWNTIGKDEKEVDYLELFQNPSFQQTSNIVKEYYEQYETNRGMGESPDTNVQWTELDLRLNSLSVSGFRGFPPVKQDELGYGLAFSMPDTNNRRIPCSTILLGSNGSGKTSLYSAIELICTGTSAIAQKHRIESKYQSEFYHHLSDVEGRMDISITCSRISANSSGSKLTKFDKNDQIYSHISLKSFFCSESDLALFECSGKSIKEYINELIELDEILKVKDILSSYYRLLLDSFENLSESDKKDDSRVSYIHREMELAESLRITLEKVRNLLLNSVFSEAQHILLALLNDYSDDIVEPDYDTIEIEDKKVRIFNGKLRVKNRPEYQLEPRRYFNNFRFKLYLISIRVAIAFYIMKERRISFPLIFDDIFDSSDFPNRLSTKNFFRTIFGLYRELKISNRPLQLIFFTQDEVIAESVFDGKRVKKTYCGNVIKC